MSIRWEVSEKDWLAGFCELEDPPVDYVRIDLGDPAARPWLDEARERVELVGRWEEPGSGSALDRALEFDVDFLCLGDGAGELDLRRLPLRLMVEEDLLDTGAVPAHFGAAWARRIRDWANAEPGELAVAARRERVFLLATEGLPSPGLLARVQPFAVVAPVGTREPHLRALAAE